MLGEIEEVRRRLSRNNLLNLLLLLPSPLLGLVVLRLLFSGAWFSAARLLTLLTVVALCYLLLFFRLLKLTPATSAEAAGAIDLELNAKDRFSTLVCCDPNSSDGRVKLLGEQAKLQLTNADLGKVAKFRLLRVSRNSLVLLPLLIAVVVYLWPESESLQGESPSARTAQEIRQLIENSPALPPEIKEDLATISQMLEEKGGFDFETLELIEESIQKLDQFAEAVSELEELTPPQVNQPQPGKKQTPQEQKNSSPEDRKTPENKEQQKSGEKSGENRQDSPENPPENSQKQSGAKQDSRQSGEQSNEQANDRAKDQAKDQSKDPDKDQGAEQSKDGNSPESKESKQESGQKQSGKDQQQQDGTGDGSGKGSQGDKQGGGGKQQGGQGKGEQGDKSAGKGDSAGDAEEQQRGEQQGGKAGKNNGEKESGGDLSSQLQQAKDVLNDAKAQNQKQDSGGKADSQEQSSEEQGESPDQKTTAQQGGAHQQQQQKQQEGGGGEDNAQQSGKGSKAGEKKGKGGKESTPEAGVKGEERNSAGKEGEGQKEEDQPGGGKEDLPTSDTKFGTPQGRPSDREGTKELPDVGDKGGGTKSLPDGKRVEVPKEEQQLKPQHLGAEENKLYRNTPGSKSRTALGSQEFDKPEAELGKSSQPIPVEYQDLL